MHSPNNLPMPTDVLHGVSDKGKMWHNAEQRGILYMPSRNS